MRPSTMSSRWLSSLIMMMIRTIIKFIITSAEWRIMTTRTRLRIMTINARTPYGEESTIVYTSEVCNIWETLIVRSFLNQQGFQTRLQWQFWRVQNFLWLFNDRSTFCHTRSPTQPTWTRCQSALQLLLYHSYATSKEIYCLRKVNWSQWSFFKRYTN